MMDFYRSRAAIVLAVLATAAFLDQATKWLILEYLMQPPRIIPVTPFFNLTLGYNTGISFGLFGDLLADRPWILTAFNTLIVAGLLAWALFAERQMEAVGLAMIAGGALGNIIDRVRQGAVTDFLDFHYEDWHWPAFNMADVAITVGAAVLVGAGLFGKAPTTARA